MRLTAGKTEYDLPLDLYKVSDIYIRAGKVYSAIYELPKVIPHDHDMSHITRGESYRRKENPKDSIPVAYTVYPPKRGRKKSTIVFFPAPSRNWNIDLKYICIKRI